MNDGCVCTGCRRRVALRGLGRLAPAGLVGESTPPHPAGQGCEQTTRHPSTRLLATPESWGAEERLPGSCDSLLSL